MKLCLDMLQLLGSVTVGVGVGLFVVFCMRRLGIATVPSRYARATKELEEKNTDAGFW